MSAGPARARWAAAAWGRAVRGLRWLAWRLTRFRLSTLLSVTAIVAILLAWRRDRQTLQAEIDKLNYTGPNWGVQEATGPPNTQGFGDIRTAWASKEPDAQVEWLLLEFPEAVLPQAVWIYETYNPGAVVKVSSVGTLGYEKVLWEGTDPTPRGSAGGTSKIPLNPSSKVHRLKVYLDSPAVGGWNEIDAVGLVYGNNRILWPQSATASSAYNK